MLIKQHFDKLGFLVRDKITGITGIAVSVAFDLYGCINILVNPGRDDAGKLQEQYWFDVSRLDVVRSHERVMSPPDYLQEAPSEIHARAVNGDKGAANKPPLSQP